MHHKSAIIDKKAKIDEGVSIGPYRFLGPGVKIQKGSIIESHVIISGPTKIGKNNHIFQFSTVGDGSLIRSIKESLLN
ncbi:MAG: hypothetical protein Ct9H90mP4_05340 [Gammaproteobacteria bacterium]|nr:MAG: hypothetical protein Ct9H90mP4_05340 [Gammaproteobacteria bacterium]